MPSAYALCKRPVTRKRSSGGDCDSEQARVRTAIFYEKGNSFPKGTPEANAAFFTALELAGKAWIIRETSGSYDGGSAKMAPGFGDVAERLTGNSHGVIFNDGAYIGNEEFYNAIANNARDYNFAWITGSRVWIAEDRTIAIKPTAPQPDDVDADIIAVVTVNWNKKDLPVSYPIDREALREEPELAFASLTKTGAGTETVTGSTITAATGATIDSTVLITGATHYGLADGETLPAGLTIGEATGKITGTVTAPAGTYYAYVYGVNAFGIMGEKEITFVITA